jgi:large subunit ribosomal protein L30e
MVVDVNKEIRRVVDTGKVSFGFKEAKKKLLAGEGQMIIVSKNLPKNERETIKQIANIESKKFFEYPENGLVLGSVCGKPFVISTMLVLDEGKSKVLEIQ